MKAIARGEGGDQLRSASFGEGIRVSLSAKGLSKLSVPICSLQSVLSTVATSGG